MSKDNGKSKPPKKLKPAKVNVAAHLQIMGIYSELEKAKARLGLVLSILQKQLGIDESWNYQTDQRAFLPPDPVEDAVAKSPPNRISE